MDRYAELFASLDAKKEGAFVPFITLGDPSPSDSLDIMETLISAGADALELGFPFSDPLADGPTIQNATIRALQSGTTPDQCFEMIAHIRQKYPTLPIGLLMYANLVFANGIDHFYRRCQETQIDSVLIADVPIENGAEFKISADKHRIASIFIAPPNADQNLLSEIAEQGKGYTYLLSRAGVTGTETQAGQPLQPIIHALATLNAPPPLLGFGISAPEHVKAALAAGAKGAICGSAIVKIIEKHQHDTPSRLNALSAFVCKMKAATKYK
jgi:tryptophan synthase alpha chain